jgi:hypothetical protein
MRTHLKLLATVSLLTAASVTLWACGRPVAPPGGGLPGGAADGVGRGGDGPVAFTFDGPAQADGLPTPWQSRVIFGDPQTSVVDGPAAGERAIRVRCDRAHVVLSCKATVPIDPARCPIVTWSWRADALPPRGDTRTHGALPIVGDNRNDKGLQVMVAFEGDDVLNYVWDANAPAGYECDEWSPVATVKTRVVETGPPTPGQWRTERVDVRADYARRFGRPPGRITGIGISSNTNNTAALGDGAVGPIVIGTR